ncbi:8074_t:CDS:2, partial [Gigaspora margarita]
MPPPQSKNFWQAIPKVSCYGFSYYVVIWKKTFFITDDCHIIGDLLSRFKDNITLVSNSNLENTVNKKFDESAKNLIPLDFWTNNENTIIDSLEFVKFMKTKFRDITLIDNYYE